MSEETKALIPQKSQAIIDNANDYLQSVLKMFGDAQEVIISSDAEYENCNKEIKIIKASLTTLEADRKGNTQPLEKKKKGIIAHYRDNAETPLSNGLSKLTNASIKWYQKKEKERKDAQAKLDAIADEARIKAELAVQREIEKANKYEEEDRPDMAAKAEMRADIAIEKAATTVAQVLETAKPKGTSFITVWEAKLLSKEAAIKCMIGKPEQMSAVDINLKHLERLQKISEGKLVIEGVQFSKKIQRRDRA